LTSYFSDGLFGCSVCVHSDISVNLWFAINLDGITIILK